MATASCRREPDPPRSFVILGINDIYRIEGVDGGSQGGLARLRSLRAELEREEPELLLLHAGDLLFPSLLSRRFEGEQMIDVLNLLDGDPAGFDSRMFVSFGNHEFDKGKLEDADFLQARVQESQFSWFHTNIAFATGDQGQPLVDAEHLIETRLVESNGIQVGLFGLSTDQVHPQYVESFGDPRTVAKAATAELRGRGAEVVVALTHLSMSEDVALLEQLGPDGPDLVLGGHEHNQQAQQVKGRWVIKADAEAVTAAVVRVTLPPDPVTGQDLPQVEFEYRQLGPEAVEDADVKARVDDWVARHDRVYCNQELGQPTGCLDTPLGRTQVRLVGEELELRRFETNLGNWIVDQALAAFAHQGAQAALINAGSLRLNQNLPAGSEITLRHMEEIFQYPSGLRLLRMRGATLAQAAAHSVARWTGSGKWLQISGFAFRHDPATESARDLTLLTPNGPRPIEADEELLVVTGDFLADPATGQDGYTMFTADMTVEVEGEAPTLREWVKASLEAAGDEGIAPQVEGRICNPQRPGPCLALESEP